MPSSVTVARSHGALTASWNAITGATSYHITYTSNKGASWSLAALNHPSNAITISPVASSGTYIVSVRAGNDSGWSGWRNSAPVGPGSRDSGKDIPLADSSASYAESFWSNGTTILGI